MTFVPGPSHDQLATSLADHFRQRTKPPIVVGEIALAGTWGSQGRLDVATLTILPGYRGLRIEGFEVKASRGDLFRDLDADKWRRYLPCVHTMTLAMPAGLAKLDEIPDQLGIIALGPTGRWQKVRRAPALEQPTDEALMGALMRIVRRFEFDERRQVADRPQLERARRLLELDGIEDAHELAARIGGRVWELIADEARRTAAIDRRERDLDARAERLTEAERQAADAPRLLEALDQLLQLARTAVGGQRWIGTDRVDEARGQLIDLAETLSRKDVA